MLSFHGLSHPQKSVGMKTVWPWSWERSYASVDTMLTRTYGKQQFKKLICTREPRDAHNKIRSRHWEEGQGHWVLSKKGITCLCCVTEMRQTYFTAHSLKNLKVTCSITEPSLHFLMPLWKFFMAQIIICCGIFFCGFNFHSWLDLQNLEHNENFCALHCMAKESAAQCYTELP